MTPRELSTEQCRVVARLRARLPEAEIRLHLTRRGLVVEIRRGRRSELAHLDAAGVLVRERRLSPLAAYGTNLP